MTAGSGAANVLLGARVVHPTQWLSQGVLILCAVTGMPGPGSPAPDWSHGPMRPNKLAGIQIVTSYLAIFLALVGAQPTNMEFPPPLASKRFPSPYVVGRPRVEPSGNAAGVRSLSLSSSLPPGTPGGPPVTVAVLSLPANQGKAGRVCSKCRSRYSSQSGQGR